MHCQYREEIYHSLRGKELRSRVHFLYQSPQIMCRRHFMLILNALGQRLKLCEPAVHLAAMLMDRFMDHHNVAQNRLDLLVAVCVLIAAKVELTDAKIPLVSQLRALLRGRHLAKDFVHLERILAKFFDWTLMLPTAAHFAELLLPAAVSAADLERRDADPRRLCQLQADCRELVSRFLGATLFEVHQHDFLPSLVASTCVMAARSALRLRDVWPRRLLCMTGHAVAELRLCADVVLPRPHKRQHMVSPDGGYESDVDYEDSPRGKRMNRGMSPVV